MDLPLDCLPGLDLGFPLLRKKGRLDKKMAVRQNCTASLIVFFLGGGGGHFYGEGNIFIPFIALYVRQIKSIEKNCNIELTTFGISMRNCFA